MRKFIVNGKQALIIIFVSTYFSGSGRTQDLIETPSSSRIQEDIKRILMFITNRVGRELSINVGIARYFSRTFVENPLPELFLSQPLYGVEWFTQFGKILSNQRDNLNLKDVFYALAKFSSDVKRIDIVKNPAEKMFSNPPTGKVKVLKGELTDEELKAVAGFSECIRIAKEKFDDFIFRNPEFMMDPITNFINLATLSTLPFKYEKALKFLEILNTSQYLLLLCFDNLVKDIKKFHNSFVVDSGGIAFEVYGNEDDFIVIPNSPAVIIDLGGSDTYFFWRWDQYLSASSFFIIVDLGNDKDLYRFVGGRSLYISLIFDEGGDDLYECEFSCQGGGFLGSEILVDVRGNDHYKAFGIAQGAGFLGSGILLDLSGDDLYESTTFSQGFGKIGGGLLVDFSGNDKYFLRKGNEFPSFQDSSKNLSMGQGCGTGIRADYIESYESVAGGVGLLYDLSGDDEYSAEVFSQGCGYWYGIGVLIDIAGNDKYIGYWYCQGTSAHFGAGMLIDSDGSDYYLCNFQGIGHGHDLGYGVLIDFARSEKADSDNFSCKERCLGMGHANGVGIFFNRGGYDEYKAEKYAFGDAITNIYSNQESIRDIIPTVGVFIDIGEAADRLVLGNEMFNPQIRKIEDKDTYLRRIFIKQKDLEDQIR